MFIATHMIAHLDNENLFLSFFFFFEMEIFDKGSTNSLLAWEYLMLGVSQQWASSHGKSIWCSGYMYDAYNALFHIRLDLTSLRLTLYEKALHDTVMPYILSFLCPWHAEQ